jgi:ribosomal protein L37AE/L43A
MPHDKEGIIMKRNKVLELRGNRLQAAVCNQCGTAAAVRRLLFGWVFVRCPLCHMMTVGRIELVDDGEQ